MEGIIYILTNPAMPDIVKIGKTSRIDIKVRIAELYGTGIPLPFDCVYASRVNDIDKVEKALHTAFNPNRLNPKREFFEIEPLQAIAIIKLLEIENVTPSVERETNSIDNIEIEAGHIYAQKRPNFNFLEMNIPIGSELVSTNTGEVAIVNSEKMVVFRDEETSLTNATRMVLGKDSDYRIAPGPYWTFEGRKLRDVYNETYKSVM